MFKKLCIILLATLCLMVASGYASSTLETPNDHVGGYVNCENIPLNPIYTQIINTDASQIDPSTAAYSKYYVHTTYGSPLPYKTLDQSLNQDTCPSGGLVLKPANIIFNFLYWLVITAVAYICIWKLRNALRRNKYWRLWATYLSVSLLAAIFLTYWMVTQEGEQDALFGLKDYLSQPLLLLPWVLLSLVLARLLSKAKSPKSKVAMLAVALLMAPVVYTICTLLLRDIFSI